MNKNGIILMSLVFFAITFVYAPLTHYTVSSSITTIQTSHTLSFRTVGLANYTINVDNNTQLANWASSGNGSSENPYIIKNYNINCTSNTEGGISIQNTNKSFVLQNITLSNCGIGFYFSHVVFGSIIHSFAINIFGSGFYLSHSLNDTLTNNTAAQNVFGFDLEFSNNNLLSKNTGIQNDNSFYLESSNNNLLVNNTATNNGNAFSLFNCYDNLLVNNTATNNSTGFDLSDSSYNSLSNNTTTGNYWGCSLESSSNNSLSNNTALSNNYGFYLDSSNNNTLSNNIGQNNQKYDYYAINSSNNILIHNTFGNSLTTNTLYPSTTSTSSSTANNPVLRGPFGILGTIDILSLLGLGLAIVISLTIILYFRKKKPNRIQTSSQNSKGSTHIVLDSSRKTSLSENPTTSIMLVEDIIQETYQAPDYATAVKVQQGGFPDYATYKQAVDQGIRTYTEWIHYYQHK